MTLQMFWLMAITCAVAVANLYYNQPILAAIAESFNASADQVGWIPTLTQLGYASGLLLFVPLGDRLERRQLIVTMLLITASVLIIAALSPNLNSLVVASYGIGATTIVAQILLPFATELVPPNAQGKIVGNLMSALFVGSLLARPVGGWLGEQYGWRSIYWSAGGGMTALAIASAQLLPKSQPTLKLTYLQLLQSLWGLVKSQPVLREASLIQAILFGALSVFWSTLAFLLTRPPYSYGSNVVGLFGFVGIGGILAAPVLGQIAARGTAKTLRSMVGMALVASIAAYLIFWKFETQVWGLIVGSMLLNLSSQGALVANQVKVYSLLPDARSRLNTVFMVSTFLGASLGSVVGTYGWSAFQWTGVCLAGLLLIGIAGIRFGTIDIST
ncbi:MFS transporter [Chlorogloeopsis sp. ULAP01]|uniref:MFS transporter n=1 Tax=Chlorogloeopsis sp. ULAP01 TaxID=3056483 RepID=UPI0025AA8827|nr:MFS transporter [Chlorogloeopsis sp. ULAP01]MDM9384652.1 MFS transporter [Chlorogloeopsis sp. ULAP01]